MPTFPRPASLGCLLALAACDPPSNADADTNASNPSCADDGTSGASEDTPVEIHYGSLPIDGVQVAYREAGPSDAPTIVLLHGFPTSSHYFRDLIPALADRFHVIAPDYPGFGQSDAPSPEAFDYTFDHLAEIVDGLLDAKGIDAYALYVSDYGAPIGWRLAVAHPQAVTALFVQNGIAYTDGLSEGLAPLQAYWGDPVGGEAGARGLLTLDTTKLFYLAGAPDPSRIAPEGWTLDQALLDRPGNDLIQLALFYDYQNNVAQFAETQAYFREHQPPTLVVWGSGDPLFLPAAAQAYLTDLPEAQLELLDAPHFALADHHAEIAAKMRAFADTVPALR